MKEEDFNNGSFVIDCYAFVLLYLNPFFLERKFDSQLDKDYIETLWNSIMPSGFYNFISNSDNYATLNKIKLRFQDTIEIGRSFADDITNYRGIKDVLKTNHALFQYLFSNLFPRYFSRIDDYGIRSKLTFENNIISIRIKNVFWQTYILNPPFRQQQQQRQVMKMPQQHQFMRTPQHQQ